MPLHPGEEEQHTEGSEYSPSRQGEYALVCCTLLQAKWHNHKLFLIAAHHCLGKGQPWQLWVCREGRTVFHTNSYFKICIGGIVNRTTFHFLCSVPAMLLFLLINKGRAFSVVSTGLSGSYSSLSYGLWRQNSGPRLCGVLCMRGICRLLPVSRPLMPPWDLAMVVEGPTIWAQPRSSYLCGGFMFPDLAYSIHCFSQWEARADVVCGLGCTLLYG